MSVFEIKDLNLSFRDGDIVRQLFENASVKFESGKVYAVMGRSGSGKSSFISVISGLIKANNVCIEYDGKRVDDNMLKFRKENISMVFQDYNLIDYLSPIQNIHVASTAQLKTKLEKNFIQYLLDLVGINIMNAKKPVSKLSGGEKQRVAIARALSIDCPILLADEPTGNLDVENEVSVMKLFNKIAKESNKIVIIVTHSNDVAKECDVVYRLEDGGFRNVTL
ncbi:MAG: ABC transporter ATP-binding protein [Bacilli bacterium]